MDMFLAKKLGHTNTTLQESSQPNCNRGILGKRYYGAWVFVMLEVSVISKIRYKRNNLGKWGSPFRYLTWVLQLSLSYSRQIVGVRKSDTNHYWNSLKPALTAEVLDKRLQKDLIYIQKQLANGWKILLPNNLILDCDKSCWIASKQNQLIKLQKEECMFVSCITTYDINCKGASPAEAIVTAGGISRCKEFSPKTMES